MLCRRLSADRTDTLDMAFDIRFLTSVDILPRWSPSTGKGQGLYTTTSSKIQSFSA